LDRPSGSDFPSDSGDLVGEPAHHCAAVCQEIDDFDDDNLMTSYTFELDVDRPGSPRCRIDRKLCSGGPTSAAGQGDDQLLSPKVFNVPRQVGSWHCFEEGGQLSVNGSSAGGQGLQGCAGSSASLEPAPKWL
jgi:hypothetical protein